jgi:hypothetical protein
VSALTPPGAFDLQHVANTTSTIVLNVVWRQAALTSQEVHMRTQWGTWIKACDTVPASGYALPYATTCTLTGLASGSKFQFYLLSRKSTFAATAKANDASKYMIAVWTKPASNHVCDDEGGAEFMAVRQLLNRDGGIGIVDGNANHYIRLNPLCDNGGACARALPTNFSKTFANTSIGLSVISASAVSSMRYQATLGASRNIQPIRTVADLDALLTRPRKHGLLVYTQSHQTLGGVAGYQSAPRGWHDDGLRMLQLAYSENSANTGVDER